MIGLILVVSSVMAVGHFVRPNSTSPISAEEEVNFVPIPAECFYLTKEYAIDGDESANTTLGDALKEGVVDETNGNASLPCYAILSLKSSDYKITEGKYKGMTLGQFLTENPYVYLPKDIVVNGTTKAFICGISYINHISQISTNGYNTDTSDINKILTFFSDGIKRGAGAFDMSVNYKTNDKGEYVVGSAKRTFEVQEDTKDRYLNSATKLLKGVFIPNTYRKIANMSFSFSNIEKVVFAGNNIGNKYFGVNVFDYCLNLKSVNVNESKNTLPSNVNNNSNSYPAYVFSNTAIESVHISKNFKTIGSSAFLNCEFLKEVEFEMDSAINTIESNAFKNDISLRKINIDKTSLVDVKEYGFYNTPSLMEFHLPKGISTINSHNFEICTDGYPEYYATSFDKAVEGITYNSPRAIIFDGDRSNYNINGFFYNFMFSEDHYDDSKNYMKYNYCYYDKNTKVEEDLFATYLSNLFKGKSYVNNYFDHTTFSAIYEISYEYVNEKNETIERVITITDTSKISTSDNAWPSTYKFGSMLTIENNGYGIEKYNDLDLTTCDFKGWSGEIRNDSETIHFVELDENNKSDISNKTQVFTDVAVKANYVIKKYDLTIQTKNANYVLKDVPYGYSYDWAMKTIEHDSSKDGDILNYKRFINGDLDPKDMGFVGLYTDNSFTTLLNLNDKITNNVKIYERSCNIDEIFNMTLSSDGNSYVLSSLKKNMSNISQIYIPAKFNGKDISGIADRLFTNNKSLKRLYFGDFEKDKNFSIGKYAFQGCTVLEYAELPACNISVDAYAFNNTGLSSITLLGSSNFGTRGTYSFNSTALPASCIMNMDYSDITSTDESKKTANNINVSIEIDGEIIKYSLFPHHFMYFPSNNDYNKSGYVLLSYTHTNTSTSFTDGYWHYNSFIESENMGRPNKNSAIEYKANIICKYNIESGNTVTGWSDDYNKYVDSLKIDDKDTYYSVVDLPADITEIKDNAFENDTRIKEVRVNNELSTIGVSSFCGCENLEKVIFPHDYNVSLSVNQEAFKGCSKLASFGVIDKSSANYVKLSSIGDGSFDGCTNLSTFNMSKDSTLNSIGKGAFSDSGITSIVIPNSVNLIYEYAFSNTTNLREVIFDKDSSVDMILSNAFSGSGISNINLGNTKLNTLGESAFCNTKNLDTLTLKNSLGDSININKNVVYGSAVRKIIIQNDFGFFGNVSAEDFFAGANNLEKILIEKGKNKYQNYFADGENSDGILYENNGDTLTILYIPKSYKGDLVIPDKVKTIYANNKLLTFFNDLKNVTSIKMNATDISDKDYVVFDGALYHIDNLGKATLSFVPNKLGSVFDIVNTISFGDRTWNLSEVDEYAFNSNNNIRLLQFADDVDFESVPVLHSKSIEAIAISKNIKKMTQNNFEHLSNLKSIKVKDLINVRGEAYLFDSGLKKQDVFGEKNIVLIVPNKDIDVYTSFAELSDIITRSTLQIVFDTNGGKDMQNLNIDFGTVPALTNAEKVGYDFVDWYIDSALTKKYNPETIYSDLTLYAKYDLHFYSYTYMVDGKSYHNEQVAYGAKAIGPDTEPTKKGKIFVCWKTEDGVEYSLDNNQAVSDMILKAEFKTDSKYITKIAIVSAGALVVFGVLITIIVKLVKKKSKSN